MKPKCAVRSVSCILACGLALCAALQASQSDAQTAKTVNTVQQSARQSTASAPTLQIFAASAGQADLCVGEVSGAYGNAMLAVTVDFPRRDSVCSLLRQSKWAADLGHPDVAYQIGCESAEWRAADAKTVKQCR